MDVAAWLKNLGLERSKQAFEDNAIDFALLSGLTPDHLRYMRIAAVRHRRRLLEVIGVLQEASGECRPKTPPLSPARLFVQVAPRAAADGVQKKPSGRRQRDVFRLINKKSQPKRQGGWT